MQQRIDEKDESFEARLRIKVDEWKQEWDEVEEGLRSEIRRLKNEVSDVMIEKYKGTQTVTYPRVPTKAV